MEKLNEQQTAKLAQLSVKQQTSAADFQRIAIEIQLRQWCVEQANVFCEHNGAKSLDATAKSIFDFVIDPLAEKGRSDLSGPKSEDRETQPRSLEPEI